MLRPSLFHAAAVLVLTGCSPSEPTTPHCLAGPSAPTADTLIGAVVSGRQVLVDSAKSIFWGFGRNDSVPFTELFGQVTDGYQQNLRIDFWGPTHPGVGSYHIEHDGAQPTGVDASYWCQGVDDQVYISTGGAGDSVRIATWDSVTGEISGTFNFAAVGYAHDDTLEVELGTFHGYVKAVVP